MANLAAQLTKKVTKRKPNKPLRRRRAHLVLKFPTLIRMLPDMSS